MKKINKIMSSVWFVGETEDEKYTGYDVVKAIMACLFLLLFVGFASSFDK